MKIAICTLHLNDWYSKIVRYGVQTIRNYAERHGYDFYEDNDVYDGERDFPWYKIKAIQKRLADYDAIMWIDADGHILKPEVKAEDFMETYIPDKDILCGKDWNGILNTGVMILRNTPYVHSILQQTWDNKEAFDKSFHEQASLADLYTRDVDGSKSKIYILPIEQQRVLFCYWYAYYPDNKPFFMHIARCSGNREGFIFTLDSFCPLKMEEETQERYERRMKWLATPELCRKDIDGWLNGSGMGDCISARNYKIQWS